MGNGWQLDKRITWGNLLTVLSVLAATVVFAVRLEGRVNINADGISDNSIAINKVESKQDTQYSEITRLLERISDKLDLKADKQ